LETNVVIVSEWVNACAFGFAFGESRSEEIR